MIVNTKFFNPSNFIAIGLLSMIFKIVFEFAKSKLKQGVTDNG